KKGTWHTGRHCGGAMLSGGASSSLSEMVDGFVQFRFVRIGMHINDKDTAGLEAGEPKLTAVVGDPAVMRLITSIDGRAADDFAVGRRAGFYIDRNEFVRAIAHSFDPECPNIDKPFLSIDAGEVR